MPKTWTNLAKTPQRQPDNSSNASSSNSSSKSSNKCQECGCQCESCSVDLNNLTDIHLHQEIEDLKGRLGEKEHQIVTMESQILVHANQYPHGEMAALRESLHSSADRYERLLENYRKLQKVNQGLEDKLLRLADKFEAEKISLTASVAELSSKLATAESSVSSLTAEAETYKADCNLAIRMLQCRPSSSFVAQKLESFPSDVQERVQAYLNYRKQPETVDHQNARNGSNGKSSSNGGKLIRVPIPTFPPTAVLYSLNKSDDEDQHSQTSSENGHPPTNRYISAAIMAKILEERERERVQKLNGLGQDMSTQTGETSKTAEFYIDMDEQQTRSHNRSSSGGGFFANASTNAFQARPPPTQQNLPPVMRPRSTMANETIII